MSGKSKQKKSKQNNTKTAAAKRPAGMSNEEYEEYLEITEAKKEAAAIGAERERIRNAIRNNGRKQLENTHSAVSESLGKVEKVRKNIPAFKLKTKAFFVSAKRFSCGFCARFSQFSGKISDFMRGLAEKKCSFPLFAVCFFLCYFLFNLLSGYNFLSLSHCPDFRTYQFYISDFSCGFVSRVLVGAVITHFTDRVSLELMAKICSWAVITALAMQSVIGAQALRISLKKKSRLGIFASLVFALSPLTSSWITQVYGTIDVFVLIIFLIFIILLPSGISVVLAPAICLAAMTTHEAFMCQFAPAIVAILFFKAFYENSRLKRALSGISFTLSAGTCAGSFIWFVSFADKHLLCSEEEYNALLESRLAIPPETADWLRGLFKNAPYFRDFFRYYIFRNRQGLDVTKDSDFLTSQMNHTFSNVNIVALKNNLYILLPVVIVLFVVIFRMLKKEKGAKKLPWLMFSAVPFQFVPAFIMSTDTSRFTGPLTVSVLSILFVVINRINISGLPRKKTFNSVQKGALEFLTAAAVFIYIAVGFSFASM